MPVPPLLRAFPGRSAQKAQKEPAVGRLLRLHRMQLLQNIRDADPNVKASSETEVEPLAVKQENRSVVLFERFHFTGLSVQIGLPVFFRF